MDRIYIVFGFCLCGYFAWCIANGALMFDFEQIRGDKPTGPGQHFHK